MIEKESVHDIIPFLEELKVKLNLKTVKDWNSITRNQIQSYGGGLFLNKYSIFEIKCFGFPDGKYFYDKPQGFWKNEENIQKYLHELKLTLNLNTQNDWNKLTYKQIVELGGSSLFNKYSLNELKSIGFPEGKFKTTKSSKKTSGYWNKIENVHQFIEILRKKLNLKTKEDWNLLTRKQIQLNGGGSLLNKYSLFEIKCLGFPEGKLLFNESLYKSSGYWDDKENVKKFLENFSIQFHLKTAKDWNLITQKQILSNGGGSLIQKYSLFELKCLGYPKGKFLYDKPHGYWDNKENIIQFLVFLKEKLKINDWNELTANHVLKENGGFILLQKYSIFQLKCMVFDDENYFLIQPKPSGFWDDEKLIFKFLHFLKLKLNLNSIMDWNLITRKHIESYGGCTLLNKYSIYELKCLACPEGKEFFDKPISYKPIGFWDNDHNISNFVNELKLKMKLKTPEDWNRLSKHQIKFHGGSEKLSLNQIIQSQNLRTNDNVNVIDRGFKRSSQRWLFLQIQKLFPGEEIVEDYFHSELSRKTGCAIQFDVFLTQKNIAIEYHGQQHYDDISAGFASLEMYKNRDEEKRKLCKEFGIQLVVIPYWWDNQLDSLKATLVSEIPVPTEHLL